MKIYAVIENRQIQCVGFKIQDSFVAPLHGAEFTPRIGAVGAPLLREIGALRPRFAGFRFAQLAS
jgi:hypothetical protein